MKLNVGSSAAVVATGFHRFYRCANRLRRSQIDRELKQPPPPHIKNVFSIIPSRLAGEVEYQLYWNQIGMSGLIIVRKKGRFVIKFSR